MKKKCLFSIILTIVLLFSGIIVCFATDASQPEMVTVKLNVCEITAQNVSLEIYLKEINNGSQYTIPVSDKDGWTKTFTIPKGRYEVEKIKKLEGDVKVSINENKGTVFETKGLGTTEVNLYLIQRNIITTPFQFIKDNIVILVLILGSCIGLFVVKQKRENGEA